MRRSTLLLVAAALLLATGSTVSAGPYDAAVLVDSPFLYYRFEEGGGTTAVDTTGGNDGTYFGVTLAQPSAMPNLGSSGLFQAGDDRIDLPSLGSYSQHSIEM